MNAHRSRRTPSLRFVPQLERLDDRCCPSAVAAVHGHTLLVLGDNSADTVTVTDNGTGGISATVTNASGTQTASGTDITNVVVITRGGDDTVNYNLTGTLTSPLHLLLNLGKGSDVANLDFSAGVSSSRLKIDLEAGQGNDAVTSKFGAITGTEMFFRAELGKGDDKFDATLAGNISAGAEVRFHVEGNQGADTIGVHATAVNIAADSLLGLKLDGGKGADTITVDYSGQVNGALRVKADGGKDADTITANLTIDSGSTGSVNAKVKGGKGDDLLTLNVTDNSGGGGASTLSEFEAVIDGGPGFDTCVHTPNVVVKNCEA